MAVDVKPKAQEAKAEAAIPVPERKIQLELTIYTRYTRAGHLYEKDKVYEFNESQADILMQEVEEASGLPLWRKYKPRPTPKEVRIEEGRRALVDATGDHVVKQERVAAPDGQVRGIQVGSDDELSDIPGLNDNAVEI